VTDGPRRQEPTVGGDGGDADAGGRHPPAAGVLAVRWLGHATVLIELDGVRLLTDPVLAGRIGPLVRIAAPVELGEAHGLDAVLLSHLHADHAHIGSLRSVGRDVRILAPAGSRRWLATRGFRNVDELACGEHTEIAGVRVRATPAAHEPGRWRTGRGAQPVGFLVSGSLACYFAGDTDIFPAMGQLAGLVDIALLPIAGWGPRVGPGHLDPQRAAEAAASIAPRVAVPIHWGTLALNVRRSRGGDPGEPARRFVELAARLAPEVEVRVLAPGERTELSAPAGPDPGRARGAR
jgi:L-ascorbate metabolism protein UlaG (beta-lactamase superfamily)